MLKGQWSWCGEQGLGGERAGWALALHSAGPPVCPPLVLPNLLKGTADLDAPRGRKNRKGWGFEKCEGALVHRGAPWGT